MGERTLVSSFEAVHGVFPRDSLIIEVDSFVCGGRECFASMKEEVDGVIIRHSRP